MSRSNRRGPKPREIADLVRDILRARAPLATDQTKGTGDEREGGETEDVRREGRGTAMFLVGAGCSKSAGIPLASEIAQKAAIALERDYRAADPARAGSALLSNAVEALHALIEGGHVPARFMPKDGTPRWADLYSYVFSEHIKHPNHQRALIASLVDTEKLGLNWSHACLGELVNLRFVHTVLTTNFDQLVLKGIIRTGIIPVVADGLESLIRISAKPRWPQVVHVHGSMHTYELRNSYDALRETEDDAGLQSLMLSVLKETTVLVVIGYSGGEEGVMSLLQQAAKSLSRMVVYWIAHESDYANLSERARDLLETGEYKYFVLDQDSDDFFNKLLGELGVGPPGWIKRPLAVLEQQAKIAPPPTASDDVQALIEAYADRVRFAVEHGELEDTPEVEATERRSANRFLEAAEKIAADHDYTADERKLRLHATSLFDLFKAMPDQDLSVLEHAIEEFQMLVSLKGAKLVSDIKNLIEARLELYDRLPDEGDQRPQLADSIAASAALAQTRVADGSREWALMEHYRAEVMQQKAERLKRDPNAGTPEMQTRRAKLLTDARVSYEAALPVLSSKDVIKAKECKEALAGALTELAELRPRTAKANLRQAKALFQEVIDFARRNTPGMKYAGALENFAEVFVITAKRHPEDARAARDEARALLREAENIYHEVDDVDGLRSVRSKLSNIEE